MRALTLSGAAVAALWLAGSAAATESAITWHENWDDAAKAAKTKGSVVFVYVHRLEPH